MRHTNTEELPLKGQCTELTMFYIMGISQQQQIDSPYNLLSTLYKLYSFLEYNSLYSYRKADNNVFAFIRHRLPCY